MGDLTAHFSAHEFTCTCGCKMNDISRELVNMLEKVYTYFEKTERGVTAIIITSGFRCPRGSVAVGGSVDDAHTHGIAADFVVLDKSGLKWDSKAIAAVCEYVGFSGIGVIDGTAVHADIRNGTNYKNAHWFGDERTGNDNITTWREYLPHISAKTTKTLKVTLDGVTILEREV